MNQGDRSQKRPPNHLAGQTSPYLLQHLHNPVDWYPWGPEALERARAQDRPIFLSVGYAACHWCHVMERESFEDPEIAELLNGHFVSIKVDREERPDVDEIYMMAVQSMTGQGGWPLSVFLTPDRRPFFGGTYFPPEDRWGRAGFRTVLQRVVEAWNVRREDIENSAGELTEHIRSLVQFSAGASTPVGRTEIERAAAELAGRFDERWGGFGSAPKFPPHGAVSLLLRESVRTGQRSPRHMAETTLDRMCLGGIYDQIGGGFSRYSVDERWLVPHFEKMLYDQALLVPVYVDAWLLGRKPLYRRVVEDTLDFVRRELTDPRGGFWSSLDADSDGHEGRYYLWSPGEIIEVLGATEGKFFCEMFGVEEPGNFEGKSIANLLSGSLADRASEYGTDEEGLLARIAPLRARLLSARNRRTRPGTDDKVLTSWNGLMISALAKAYQAFGRKTDLEAARRAADFARSSLIDRDGRLSATWRKGPSPLNAYLDDHVFLARGLLDLFESDFDPTWLQLAGSLLRETLHRFGDGSGGFYFTSHDHEPLLTRTRSLHDGALPSGAGVAAEALWRVGVHLDEPDFRKEAERCLAALRPMAERAPSAFASLLVAADLMEGPSPEIVIVGDGDDPAALELLDEARHRYLPARILAFGAPGKDGAPLPLLRGKASGRGGARAYVCHDYACEAPTTERGALREQLDRQLRRR